MTVREYPALGETIYSEVLENGLAVYVMPKKDYVKTFAAFGTKYGGSDCRFKLGEGYIETPAGIAHFLEHKMFDMPDGNDAMMTMSALGASPNAFTGSDSTCYIFECTDRYDECLRELLRFVQTPYFTDESVKKEQGIIGQEIRMCEDSPGRVVYENLINALYESHPVRISVPGTIESIAEITPQTLYDCHKTFYNPSNMVLAVAGNVDPEQVFSIAKELVTAEAGEIPVRDYAEEKSPFVYQNRIERSMAVAVPMYMIGVKLEPSKDGGEAVYRQSLVAELAMEYLVGPSSDLYLRLYEDGVINDSFGAGIGDGAGALFAYISAEGNEYEQISGELIKEAERISSQGIDRELFARLQRSAIGGTLRTLNVPENCCMMMVDGYMYGYDPLSDLDIFAGISAEDISAFIRENIVPEKLSLSVIKPVEKV